MPRFYIRKTEKQSWTSESLKNAIKAIREGSKIREAGRNFGIPESTLRDKIKISGSDDRSSLGRKPIFTKKQETEFTEHVAKLAKLFYGVTPFDLRRIAYDFAAQNGIRNNFNETKRLAGKDWLYLFLKRNPQISLRQPEGTSINRISSFNAEDVKCFFSNLEILYRRYNFPANRVFNCDETGITTVPKKSGKMYAARGQKQVGIATSAERGKNVTVMCCMNAAGGYIAPMFIFPRKRMSVALEAGGPSGAIYDCSDSGWINEDLFIVWLRHFQKQVKATEDDPVVLICDNHGSHISLPMFNFCKEHHIHVLSLPPHTSHRIQPLDVTFYGPFKTAYYRECDLHISTTAHKKITMFDIAGLFNKAYLKVATMEKAVSGFNATGICPLNPDKFTEDDFTPAQEFRTIFVDCDTEEDNVPTSPSPVAGTSTSRIVSEMHCSPAQNSSLDVSIQDIAPIPKKDIRRIIKRGPKKQHSTILTSTPIKNQLIAEKEKKEAKLLKKATQKAKAVIKKDAKKRKLKKKVENESETEESDFEMPDIVDDVDDNDPEDRDTCMFCEEFGRDKELWFRCVSCGRWAHQECSGWDSADNYTCDMCGRKSGKEKRKLIL